MASLLGTNSNTTYADLLQSGTADGTGITSTVKTITDGKGTSTALGLSTAQVNCANVTFNGHTISSTDAAAITVTPNVTFSGNVTISGTLTASVSIPLTSTYFLVGNASNIGTGVAMSGDATLANTGAVTVSSIGGKAVTLGGSLTTSGAFGVTFTLTGTTSVTLPTSGTLVAQSGILGTPASGTLTNCTGLPGANLTLTDVTTNNASTSNHGFLKKLDNTATHYMDGTGSWSTPPGKLLAIQVFTSTGNNTYTPTAGTNTAFVELWGAGGGGGATTSSTVSGAGGGAGAYSAAIVTGITGTYTISIGTGGNGQVKNNGTAGTNGGNTTFGGTTVIAAGGTASSQGTAGAGGAVASCTGTIKIAGGLGDALPFGGPFNGGGSSPRNTPITASYSAISGVPPANSGGGGSGGISTTDATAGASGYAVVWEYS